MTVSAVIPAYNEESTITDIISTLNQVSEVTQIVVVSDGSKDNTVQKARNAGAHVIELTENIGKGGAMMIGVKETRSDIILFLDADLIGLTSEHIRQLIQPVLNGEADMAIGVFDQGRLITDLAQFVAPYLSGQRVVRKQFFDKVADLKDSRFGIEVALTKFAHHQNIHIKEVYLPGMSHVMKEEKFGFKKGFAARMKMYWEIAKAVRS